MPTNDFLPFATGGGANVVDQPTYSAAPYVATGRGSGILPSPIYNKIARQGNFGAAGLAQFMMQQLAVDILDDGNFANFTTLLTRAISSRLVVPAAGLAFSLTSSGSLIVRSNAGAAMTDTLPSGPVNPAGSMVNVLNADVSGLLAITSAAVIKDLNLGFVILGPGQSASFVSDGVAYWPVNMQENTRLGANTTLFSSSAGNNANPGVVAGSPKLTRQGAADMARTFDLNGFIITIQSATPQTTTDAVSLSGVLRGQKSPDQLVFRGDPATPGNCNINPPATVAFTANYGAMFTVDGFAFASPSGVLNCFNDASIIGRAMTFGASAGNAHVFASAKGKVLFNTNYTINGGAGRHYYALDAGQIRMAPGITVTVTGAPAFSAAFAQADMLAYILASGAVFSGGATGTRWIANGNAVLNSATGTPNVFWPGNANGIPGTGAQSL